MAVHPALRPGVDGRHGYRPPAPCRHPPGRAVPPDPQPRGLPVPRTPGRREESRVEGPPAAAIRRGNPQVRRGGSRDEVEVRRPRVDGGPDRGLRPSLPRRDRSGRDRHPAGSAGALFHGRVAREARHHGAAGRDGFRGRDPGPGVRVQAEVRPSMDSVVDLEFRTRPRPPVTAPGTSSPRRSLAPRRPRGT